MNHKALKSLAVVLGSTAALALTLPSAAAFPDRPITFVAPYNPGGTVDPTARITAAAVSEILGQPVVVENRAGAAGSIGTEYVANSEADGYTVLIHTNVVASEPCLKSGLGYNFLEDMTSVTNLVETPFAIIVNPGLPIESLEELVAYAEENPGELLYGAAGVGSSGHLRGEQFLAQTGLEMDFIPYQGGADTLAALAGNEIQVAFDTLVGSRSMIQDGRLRALSVSTDERWPLVDSIPTMTEQGFETLENQWIGAFVPAGTPEERIAILEEAFMKAISRDDVIERFNNVNFTVVGRGAGETQSDLEAEVATWCDIIDNAGISID